MKNKKYFKRSLSAIMSALVVFSGAAVLGSAASLDANAYEAAGMAAATNASAVTNISYLGSSAITKGSGVYVYGKVSAGNTTGYAYAYYYKKYGESSWTTAKGFSKTTRVKITPDSTGVYYVRVIARDPKGVKTTKTLALKVYSPLVNKIRIAKSQIAIGSSVYIRGVAAGGSGNYTYSYYYKKTNETSWKAIKGLSSTTLVAFKPSTAGDYDILVNVKSPVGGVVKKTLKLNVSKRLVNTSTVTPTTIGIGQSVTVTASSKDGIGSCQYAYFYKLKKDTNWTLLKNYSYTERYTITLNSADYYQILVRAKDASGSVSSKILNVVVNANGLDARVAKINSQIIKSGMSEFDKVKAIHDWIVLNTDYDVKGAMSGNVPASSFTAEGLIDNHIAVCDGYSKTFEAMAKQAGLEVTRVTGVAYNSSGNPENHSWNQVKVDGKWYNIDVTWDDPLNGTEPGNFLYYTYFLVPDSELNKDHTAQSAKKSCTTAQPVEKLIAVFVEAEKEDGSIVYLCETDASFKASIAKMSPDKSAVYKFIYKTNTDANIVQMIKDNRPAGYYKTSMAWIQWKVNGYYIVTVTITAL